jgi:hypothetical protein
MSILNRIIDAKDIRMKQIMNKKVAILITILILLIGAIIGILASGFSRARIIEEVEIVIVDFEGLLEYRTSKLNAINSEESGYYIILPEMVSGNAVSRYMIKEIDILGEEEGELVERLPGSRIYLTKEEIENKSVTLNAVYDKKEIGEELLYYRRVETAREDRTITVRGYMPINAEVILAEVDEEHVAGLMALELDLGESAISGMYDIKLLSGEEEYNYSEFEHELIVSISDINEETIYLLISVSEEKEPITEILSFEVRNESIVFTTYNEAIYVVIEADEDTYRRLTIAENEYMEIDMLGIEIGSLSWGGTASLGFMSRRWNCE